MIEQILLWLDDSAAARAAATWALNLAQHLSARVYALYILPPEHKPATSRTRKVSTEKEEKAWELLYEVEDEAFNQNVRISLLLESGEPLERFREILTGYNPDLIVVGTAGPLSSEEIIRQSPQPVVFVKKTPAHAGNNKED
ncbi:MAG: universal stress protein [candidate division WOR-3 bacterium]|jgi:nucleotide-binding universal stress UspA family protein|nr:universal stress protein [candidate division WOR-3 bacterium]MDH7519180.1 universal stress protein [bacterium]